LILISGQSAETDYNQERELNIFLDDLLKHVKPDAAYKNLQPQLFAIIQKIMAHSKNMEKTLTMVLHLQWRDAASLIGSMNSRSIVMFYQDNFLPLLDCIEKETKVAASKNILSSVAKYEFLCWELCIVVR
jgi:hypothetical protein